MQAFNTSRTKRIMVWESIAQGESQNKTTVAAQVSKPTFVKLKAELEEEPHVPYEYLTLNGATDLLTAHWKELWGYLTTANKPDLLGNYPSESPEYGDEPEREWIALGENDNIFGGGLGESGKRPSDSPAYMEAPDWEWNDHQQPYMGAAGFLIIPGRTPRGIN